MTQTSPSKETSGSKRRPPSKGTSRGAQAFLVAGFFASAALALYPSGCTGNAGVPMRRRTRLLRLPAVVCLRLRIRSNCWVDETIAGSSFLGAAHHGETRLSCQGATTPGPSVSWRPNERFTARGCRRGNDSVVANRDVRAVVGLGERLNFCLHERTLDARFGRFASGGARDGHALGRTARSEDDRRA